MSTPYDTPPAGNPFALVALITGILSLLGNGCCCVPIISILAIFAYPLTAILMVVSLITGVLGVMRARANGEGMALAAVGLVASGVGVALLVLNIALMGLSTVLQVLMGAGSSGYYY
jgi:hypothetical protein